VFSNDSTKIWQAKHALVDVRFAADIST